MLTRTLHTKGVTQFFVLIYLLLSFSTANASFWCQGMESSFRLESNPVGKCWTACPPVDDELQYSEETTRTGVFLSVAEDVCFDFPVCSSVLPPQNRNSPASKFSATDIDPINLLFIPSHSLGAARFANPTLTFPLLPPQALTALRTVVLLH